MVARMGQRQEETIWANLKDFLEGQATPLLFGPASEAAREAKDITELWRAGEALAGSRFPEASPAFRQANVCHADFHRAVLRTLGHEPPERG